MCRRKPRRNSPSPSPRRPIQSRNRHLTLATIPTDESDVSSFADVCKQSLSFGALFQSLIICTYPQPTRLGSRLIHHIQKMTTAVITIAGMNVWRSGRSGCECVSGLSVCRTYFRSCAACGTAPYHGVNGFFCLVSMGCRLRTFGRRVRPATSRHHSRDLPAELWQAAAMTATLQHK